MKRWVGAEGYASMSSMDGGIGRASCLWSGTYWKGWGMMRTEMGDADEKDSGGSAVLILFYVAI
jgi:hypothetical protein